MSWYLADLGVAESSIFVFISEIEPHLSTARFSKNDELLVELEYDPSRINEWNEVRPLLSLCSQQCAGVLP